MQRSWGGASPEVWRTACREMAHRAQGGTALHPVVLAFIGLGSRLHQSTPSCFYSSLTFVALTSLLRLVLIRSFDRIYDRDPRLWQLGFFGGLLANCGIYGGVIYFLITEHGLTAFTLFSFILVMGLVILATVVYSHAVRVVWSCIALVGGLPILALAGAGQEPMRLWILWATVASCLYLFWVARQQHRELWEGLLARLQLASRAADLERAQIELQQARDDLARLVAERTLALERTNEDYRRIFENAHDPIIIFRPEDERVLNVNRRACEIYGFTREEFLGISLADISEDVERGQRQITETLERGVYHHFESIQFRKDGSRMFVEINASLIEYDGSQAILSINRDMTERRRAEGLRLAKEAAERTAQAKTQFLVNMSHEIRTPMAGVVGLSDLLLATDLDERQGGYARLVQSSAVSLLRVIDDILDFSKIEAGKLAFEDVPFDLRAMLRDVVGLLRIGAVARGTSLQLVVAEDVPDWVRGDPGRLRQVLMNLAGNAVKFTDTGTVTVTAELDRAGRLRLSVEDTGIGIPVEVQGRLFELFSQGDDSTSRRFGGTGLGLAISKRIVEAMGGEIGFESAPGVGSRFWIRVALAPGVPPGAEPAAERPVRVRRILTVEDNPVNQLVIVEHLKSFGYEVKAVSNGLEALEALTVVPGTTSFDLVLMDCQMPHLDGYEATARIRQLPGKVGRIPIVALTAHAIREELDKCLAVGMNTYITKPFRGEALRRMIEQWIDREGEPAGGAGEPPPSLSVPAAVPEIPAADLEGPALDERQLESLRTAGKEAASPDFLVRLVEQFRKQPYLEQFRGALDREDRTVLAARAHALKGTSLFMGAARLPRLCTELEHLCREEAPMERCRAQVDRIAAELERVLRELEAVVGAAEVER